MKKVFQRDYFSDFPLSANLVKSYRNKTKNVQIFPVDIE